MGTIAQKLQALSASKAAIKQAIIDKGVTDVGDVLSEYAGKIGEIQGGGGETIDMAPVSFYRAYEMEELPEWAKNGDWSGKKHLIQTFTNCSKLKSISLSCPNVTDAQQAFASCTSLTYASLTLPSVTNLTMLFNTCTKLSKVEIDVTGPTVRNMALSNMAQGATSLREFSITGIHNISTIQNAFSRCTALTHLELRGTSNSGFVFPNATNVCSNMLSGCTGLKELVIDYAAIPAWQQRLMQVINGVACPISSLEIPNATDLYGAVAFCSAITTLRVNAPKGRNLSYMFWACSKLESIELHTSQLAGHMHDAFGYCTALTHVDWDITMASSISGLDSSRFMSDTNLDHESLVAFIDLLPEVSGKTCNMGSANLAKLSEEEIGVATAKGWTLI